MSAVAADSEGHSTNAHLTEVPAEDGAEKFDGSNDNVEEDQALRVAEQAAEEEAKDKIRREKEARAQALTLEIVGDLPYAEVKPPENVLFVCKLNPVTEDEDLDTIFSRFGTIVSCEVIRDKRTGDSLQYAFIEFENQKDCEQAYFKMQGVLIDDHRIHVDFSQSVSRLSDKWRTATNMKRAKRGGGFGGVESLEKKRHYRAADRRDDNEQHSKGRSMIFDRDDLRQRDSVRSGHSSSYNRRSRSRNRSRSPQRRQRSDERVSTRDTWKGSNHRRDEYDDRRRRR